MGYIKYFMISLVAVAMGACGNAQNSATSDAATDADAARTMEFDADSAYAYVAAQTAFGPRVPNTDAHARCGAWLVGKLKEFGAENVTVDSCDITAYDGTRLNARNISAQINPSAGKRILLLSHWDSRPWADQEKDTSLRRKPIDGANDGASGVGVILELVRGFSANHPKVGIDVLFVDAEDYGRHSDEPSPSSDQDSWALGSKYWAENPTVDLSKVRYAVLLDMVGGKNAVFPREYFSEYMAKPINDKVWQAAEKAGYAERFADRVGTPVVDDHLSLAAAGVPTIDIIETDHPSTGSFNPTWHTLADNIDNIDRETLKAVGQTLGYLIINEK